MPSASYSALTAPTAIWVTMLSPRVANRWVIAVRIWASCSAGICANRA